MDITEINRIQSQTFRENLRLLREARGWSFYRLSRETGISISVLKKMERGGNFRLNALSQLCRFYGIRPGAMFLPLHEELMQKDEEGGNPSKV